MRDVQTSGRRRRGYRGLACASLIMALLDGAIAGGRAEASDCANRDVLGTSRTLNVGVNETPRVGLKQFPTTLPLQDKEIVLTFGVLTASPPVPHMSIILPLTDGRSFIVA